MLADRERFSLLQTSDYMSSRRIGKKRPKVEGQQGMSLCLFSAKVSKYSFVKLEDQQE